MTSTEDLANDHEQSDTTCVCSRDGDGDEANVGERLIVIGAKKSVEVTCEQQVEAVNALSDEVSLEKKDLACFDSSKMNSLYDVIRDIEDQESLLLSLLVSNNLRSCEERRMCHALTWYQIDLGQRLNRRCLHLLRDEE